MMNKKKPNEMYERNKISNPKSQYNLWYHHSRCCGYSFLFLVLYEVYEFYQETHMKWISSDIKLTYNK